MGIQGTLDTSGLDKLIAEWDGDIKKSLTAIAFEIEGEAKKRAPAIPPRTSIGALRGSIQVAKDPDPKRATIQDGVEYGIYQELGTHKMAAQPFMVPAFLQVVDKYWKFVKDEIDP